MKSRFKTTSIMILTISALVIFLVMPALANPGTTDTTSSTMAPAAMQATGAETTLTAASPSAEKPGAAVLNNSEANKVKQEALTRKALVRVNMTAAANKAAEREKGANTLKKSSDNVITAAAMAAQDVNTILKV